MCRIQNLSIRTILFLVLFFFPETGFTQRLADWNKGDPAYTKKGFMDGNLVSTVFYNFGEVGDYLNEKNRSGVWPKGSQPPHTYLDGVAIIVQAEARAPSGNLIHPLETNYYEFTRTDPTSGITYGWWPLPGYARPSQTSPARSDDPDTWPASWPDRSADVAGKWNGLLAPAKQNADLETYFVFDDDRDREYLLKHKILSGCGRHYPRRAGHAGPGARVSVVAGSGRGCDLLVL